MNLAWNLDRLAASDCGNFCSATPPLGSATTVWTLWQLDPVPALCLLTAPSWLQHQRLALRRLSLLAAGTCACGLAAYLAAYLYSSTVETSIPQRFCTGSSTNGLLGAAAARPPFRSLWLRNLHTTTARALVLPSKDKKTGKLRIT